MFSGEKLICRIIKGEKMSLPDCFKSATEPEVVKKIDMMVMSEPGLGKTSLASTIRRNLLLNCDANRIASAVHMVDRMNIRSWDDVLTFFKPDFLNLVGTNYDVITIDTIGKFIKTAMLWNALNDRSKKSSFTQLGKKEITDIGKEVRMSFNGWSNVANSVGAFLNQIKSLEKDLLLLGHIKVLPSRSKGGAETIVLKAQGQMRTEMLQSADFVGTLYFLERERAEREATKLSFLGEDSEDYTPYGWESHQGAFILDFNSHASFVGKNPIGLPPLLIPNFTIHRNWMGGLLELIKREFNSQNIKKADNAQSLSKFETELENVKDLDGFNRCLTENKQDTQKLGVLLECARTRGFFYSKESKQFESHE